MIDLYLACRSGDVALIESLLSQGPDSINERDPQAHWTPLQIATICRHEAAVALLLSRGADANAQHCLGGTALHDAADGQVLGIVKLLVKAGADVNLQDKDGDTPLHKAVGKLDASIVELLLTWDANPNLSNTSFGRTPLHYAVESQDQAIVQLLVIHGASPNIKDKRGKRSIDLAVSTQMKQLLSRHKPLRKVTESGMAGPRIFKEAQEVESIPPIPPQTFEKLKMSPSSSYSDVLTIASQGPQRKESQDESREEFLPEIPSPKERTFSFGKGGEKRTVLLSWLGQYALGNLFDVLVDSGYDDVEQMVGQMRSQLPITCARLQEIGIKQIGHATRLLAALELELKCHPSQRSNRGSSSLIYCCTSPRPEQTFRAYPSLSLWLDALGLASLYPRFVEAGYEELEPLLAVMKSSYSLSESDLEHDIHIEKPGHRHRILSKLYEDSRYFDPYARPYCSLQGQLDSFRLRRPEVIEEAGKAVSCERDQLLFSPWASCEFCRTM